MRLVGLEPTTYGLKVRLRPASPCEATSKIYRNFRIEIDLPLFASVAPKTRCLPGCLDEQSNFLWWRRLCAEI